MDLGAAGRLARSGERLDRAARRECEEEIGLRPTRLERIGAYFPTPGFCDELMMFYRCRGPGEADAAAAQDADERIEPRTFTIARGLEARALTAASWT